MNVLLTVAVLAVLAMWVMAVYNRLHRIRRAIFSEWQQLDEREKAGDLSLDGSRYNELAAKYNAALEGFPENIVGGLAGFRPAQKFVNTKVSVSNEVSLP